MIKNLTIAAVILAVLLLVFLVLKRELPKSELKLGAVETAVNSLKTEQANFLASIKKYKYKDWTTFGDSDYKVDEWQDWKNVVGFKITRRYLADVITATGTRPTYQYEVVYSQ